MEKSKRIEFVDIAKGIGIMIVCLGHSGAEDFFMPWIGGFIVPLFFILSGYMYKDKGIPVSKDLWNKGRKLLKPYFFLSVWCSFSFISDMHGMILLVCSTPGIVYTHITRQITFFL